MLSYFSLVQLFVTLRTVAHQAPLSVEFSREGYWSRLPYPTPGGRTLPDPGIEPATPVSPALQMDSLPLSHWGSPSYIYIYIYLCLSLLQCFDPWLAKIIWRRKWQPTPGFLPGKFHGYRSLAATVHGIAKSCTRLSD